MKKLVKVVLITGASRGLGAAIAKLFLENDDIVYINYNKSEKEAIELAKSYVNAKLIKCDVSCESQVKVMIEQIKEEEGHIDVLVNNAAICRDNYFNDKTVHEFQEVLNTNLIGPFLTSKYVGNLMLEQEDGVMINIASTNAIDTNETYTMDYDASKAGLISLTHNFAKALAPHIRVNAVAPGWIKTEAVMEMEPHYLKEEANKVMLERFAEPEEIAKVVFFLASGDASYINNT
ncbi:MAG: SDR family oxidoreductase, partial [Bacilli bacterium]|nr:SDR family oxidoreductase [Bacilli bacterium]